MRTSLARTTATLAGAAALLLGAGCGSSGSKSSAQDAKDIEAVVSKALSTTDPTVKCQETVTTGFVTRVYGSLATCKQAETPKPTDDPKPTGANASSVKVDGDSATAVVTVQGGSTDGASGKINFAKEGGAWKVDDLQVSFLRSSLTTSITTRPQKAGSTDPLDDAVVRTCLVKGFDALPDDQFKAIAFKAISDQDPDPKFLEIYTTCAQKATNAGSTDTGTTDTGTTDTGTSTTSDSSSQSLLRRQFESGLRQAAKKDGATDKQIDCVVKMLRRTISEDEIVAEIGRGKNSTDTTLATKAAVAIQKCGS